MDLKALRHPAGGSAARELLTQGLSPQRNGAGCSHHLECLSDCCLMDLDHGGTFCAPKAGRAMTCLPQSSHSLGSHPQQSMYLPSLSASATIWCSSRTKGATNIMCPCHMGLTCISKDLACPRRCHLL
ncbi:colipase-like protein 2 isoform X2 [Equus przewalskii]|uniref:Colipase-like protein 2 isoform X2 n=1 Tax=Equus przewalskii TaxID=9798 RepID=A0ABM4LNT5_EQUPR